MAGDVREGPLCCEICGNSYANPTYLRKHIKNVHMTINKEHQTCPKCYQTFKDLKTFWGHILQKHELCFENFNNIYDKAKEGAAVARREQKGAISVPELERPIVTNGNRITEILMMPDDPHSLNNWVSGDTCVKCDRSYGSKSGLMRHLKNVHSVDLKILQANSQQKGHTDEEILKQFGQEQEPEYSCIVCDLEFVSSEAEIRHKKSVHGILPDNELQSVEPTVPQIFARKLTFRCKDCGEKFHKLDRLEHHFLTVHRDDANYLTCNTCDLEFTTVRGMARHKKTVHGIVDPDVPNEDGLYPIKCKYCPEVLYFKDYKSHVRQFHEEHFRELVKYMKEKESETISETDPATCKICRKTVPNIKALKRHIMSVHTTPSNELSCVECGKEFKDAGGLREHLIVHQKLAVEPYVKVMLKEIFGNICHSKLTCGICQTVTMSSFEARIHVYVKHPEAFQEYITHKAAMSAAQNASFPCPVCLEPFPTTKDAIYHIEASHPETEVPTCHVCGHKELKERDMNRHFQLYHPQTSRHVCRICQAKFNQAKQLRLHVTREHTAEGVQCPYCLEKHVKVKLHVTVKHPEHAQEYAELVANAIREECNSRMEFNQLIDGGPQTRTTRRKRTKLVQSDAEVNSSDPEDENEGDEFDASEVCETKLKPVLNINPVVAPPPELYKIKKSANKHLIQVHRLSPPPPPVAEPEELDPFQDDGNNDPQQEDGEDVKPVLASLNVNESNVEEQDQNVGPDNDVLVKDVRICLQRLTPSDLERWKFRRKSVSDCDEETALETEKSDANVIIQRKLKPTYRKRRRRRR